MIIEGRPRGAWRAIESGLVEVVLLALVGLIFMTVAFVTRLVLGVDIA
jgi:hypothetical protein